MTRRVVGLTGGIGAGKTTAAEILAEFGAVVIDCDQLGRDVAEPDGSAFAAIVERFGEEILDDSGRIDRATLGDIVFSDAAALSDLNGITHPAITAEIERRIEAAPGRAPIVLDMAVLVESDLAAGIYQEVLVIEADRQQRLDRLQQQRGMVHADAQARMASQATDEERRAVADHVIVNSGTTDELRADLRDWWDRSG